MTTPPRLTHAEARALVARAFAELAPNVMPTLAELQAVQSVAKRESGYGAGWAGTPLEGSWNMGAIQAFGWKGEAREWRDSHSDGTGYAAKFRAYPTAQAGMTDLVRWFVSPKRPEVLDAAATGSLWRFCAAMYDAGYFESAGKTREERIERYAQKLATCVDAIAAGLDEPRCLTLEGFGWSPC